MRTKYILTLAILLMSFAVLAQPGTPPGTPIDGGLGFLIAGGVLYGVSKIRNKIKQD